MITENTTNSKYQDILDYMFSKLPMFQRVGKPAFKKDLTNIKALCKHLGNPHKRLRCIHIGGTNGKGSVSHILASVLQTAGYKTGLYTSPHLKDFTERIKINGKSADKNYVIEFIEKNKKIIERIEPSFFEITVAMAFDYFAKNDVDFAVIEVGLGGRLDSTNIIRPILSAITNISFDHTQFLGDNLSDIAKEKAGIIKYNVPVVIGEAGNSTRNIFIEKAADENAPIYLADYTFNADYSFLSADYKQIFNIYKGGELYFQNLKTDLNGLYQKKNVITALQIIEILQVGYDISENDIYKGILNVKNNTGFVGRWQILGFNPMTVADTGHNEAGIKEVVKQINMIAYKKLHIVFGTNDDKSLIPILKLLPKEAEYYFTQANVPRALDAKKLRQQAGMFDLFGEVYPNVNIALSEAKNNAEENDFIFIGGSTFVVAEIL